MAGKAFFSVSMSVGMLYSLRPNPARSSSGQQRGWHCRVDLPDALFWGSTLTLGGRRVRKGATTTSLRQTFDRTGASVMGKRMFDVGVCMWPSRGAVHTPVFVATHEKRDPGNGRVGPRSTSSTLGSRRRSTRPARPPASGTSASQAAALDDPGVPQCRPDRRVHDRALTRAVRLRNPPVRGRGRGPRSTGSRAPAPSAPSGLPRPHLRGPEWPLTPGQYRNDLLVDHSGEAARVKFLGSVGAWVGAGDGDHQVQIRDDLDELSGVAEGRERRVVVPAGQPPEVAVTTYLLIRWRTLARRFADPFRGHQLLPLPLAVLEVQPAQRDHVGRGDLEATAAQVEPLRVGRPAESGRGVIRLHVGSGHVGLVGGFGRDTQRVEQFLPGVVQHRAPGRVDQDRGYQIAPAPE